MLFGLIVACGLGLIFGSFGSVILSRRGDATTRKQASSILWGRSECPTCKHRLYPYDLIPLLSFLFQGGKCRYCHRKIS
ncbi:prepilin peptidase, partial [Candidatus Gracilibacteria bacterium]